MRVRVVPWPRDVGNVARALSQGDAWFWLDGSAGEPTGPAGVSYLGQSVEVMHAKHGEEQRFLTELRQGSLDSQLGVGSVAVFAYEFGVALIGEPPAHDAESPAFVLRSDVVLVLNHANRTAELRGQTEELIETWLSLHGHSFEASTSVEQVSVAPSSQVEDHDFASTCRWNRSDSRYLADIEKCQAAIRAGEAYVLCLTDSVECQALNLDALRLYEGMRAQDASIRGAVIVAGPRALVSLSPERFLSKRGKHVSSNPIKGTRPRGETPSNDLELARELANDSKERAENLMIVDLMRNDLSRVCETGSVRATDFLRVESHPRVHQLVSTVKGELRADCDVYDLLQACFPGASMTGAPKRRAVQIMAALEHAPRRLYSGCFGWIGSDGDAELAMTIRSIELRQMGTPGEHAYIGAGGGVTIESDPDAELAEKHLKAAPLLAALEPLTRTPPHQ